MTRRILITGGTGSFGRAFAKWSLGNGASRVCIYSRGELAQAQMRQDMQDHQSLRWFIGDVRDRDRLRRAMEGCDTVVHAAALKRIEVGHYNPAEMVKTNVLGAMNVIEAAHDAGIVNVVMLSTDKAWQPISAYGQSKALAESLFLAANYARGRTGPRFSVIRYGNVWNSNGSVLPTWIALTAAGHQSVPITDRRCTRFFMHMRDAVAEVEGLLTVMDGGELRIPDYLPAYQLGDLADALGVATHEVGLPPHEKLHEGLRDGLTSDKASRMTVDELRAAIAGVE